MNKYAANLVRLSSTFDRIRFRKREAKNIEIKIKIPVDCLRHYNINANELSVAKAFTICLSGVHQMISV